MNIRNRLRIRTRLRSVAYRIRPPDPKPLILMYHRIADEPIDQWRLAVTLEHFREHLLVIRRTRRPLPLEEFVQKFSAGTLPSNAITITFDDGYLDNLTAAKPLLAAADVPATVFLATGFLDRPGEFWWDELSKLVLLGTGPESLDLEAGGKTTRIYTGANSARRTSVRMPASQKTRLAALSSIWEVLQRLGDEERTAVIAELRTKIAVPTRPTLPGRAMTSKEVLNLVAGGLVSIGAHTVTHPVLPELEPAVCLHELSESKKACEALIGKPVQAFAYPYGRFDSASRALVEAAGFTSACSILHGPATATSDIFALPRIHIPNMNGQEFEFAIQSASNARYA
jgi:peptidoglycan/xylan/chitin deacetylase (PgdA/CDA1 family)